jgi:hypothetical protein
MIVYFRRLLLSKWITEKNMENARYATNDDIAGLINPIENRNTSRKIKYDLKLIKNYLHHIPYGF